MELLTTVASWFTPTTLFLLLNLTIGSIFFTNRLSPVSKKPNQDGSGSGSGHAPLARPPSLIDRVKSINFSLYSSPSPESETGLTGSSDPGPPSSSSLLNRVKSINVPYFKFPQHNSEGDYAAYALMTRPDESTNRVDPVDSVPEEPRFGALSLLQRVKSIKLPSLYRSEPEPSFEEIKPARTKSESSKPATKSKKKKTTKKKMTKSASERSGMGYIGREEMMEETVEAVEKRRPETTRVERTTTVNGEDDGEEEGVDDKASNFINKFKQQLKLQRLDSFLRYRDMLRND
ncbi:unnamed protein product [Cochlearia groenlandica]